MTEQVQDLDGSTAGLDGIVYFFSSTDAKGKEPVSYTHLDVYKRQDFNNYLILE